MLLEIRIYKTKPGCREQFIDFFENKAIPAQAAYGIQVIGQFRALEDPDTFVFFRPFENAEARETLRNTYYESPLWKETLEAEAMSLLADYSNVLLVEPTANSALK